MIRHFCKIHESVQFFNEIHESVAILGQIRWSASLFTPPPPIKVATYYCSVLSESVYIYTCIKFNNAQLQYRVWKGGPYPAFPLILYENPASHFLFILLSCIPRQILWILLPESSQILNPALFFSEILDPKNTLLDSDSTNCAFPILCFRSYSSSSLDSSSHVQLLGNCHYSTYFSPF